MLPATVAVIVVVVVAVVVADADLVVESKLGNELGLAVESELVVDSELGVQHPVAQLLLFGRCYPGSGGNTIHRQECIFHDQDA